MHVLATELATLEEADVAIDLGQSPAEIVVLSFSDSDLSALAAAWQQDADVLPTHAAGQPQAAAASDVGRPLCRERRGAGAHRHRALPGRPRLLALRLRAHRRHRARQRRAVRRPAGRRPRRSAARRGVDPGRRAAGAARPLLPRRRQRRICGRRCATSRRLLGRDLAWTAAGAGRPASRFWARRRTAARSRWSSSIAPT